MDSVSRALLITGRTVDLDPNAFGFNNVSGANLSTLITSNTITPIGYDATTTWSVTNGGQGSVNGGTFTSSGTISPGQNFRVRGTSSSSYSTTVQFLVSIGATQSTWSITTMAQPTEVIYSSPGTYSFVVPAGVTSISAVCVGGGQGATAIFQAGASGATLRYINNRSVTPGETLTVTVGAGGQGSVSVGNVGGDSNVMRGNDVLVQATNLISSNTIGSGGNGGSGNQGGGGGGAGGYTGHGGSGGGFSDGGGGVAGTGGAGGGGGGGGATSSGSETSYYGGGGGGGVGPQGQGNNGSGGPFSTFGGGGGGGGSGAGSGSGGGSGIGGIGGGGGVGNAILSEFFDPYTGYYYSFWVSQSAGGRGGHGIVRIIWPGSTRLFPSTNTGTM